MELSFTKLKREYLTVHNIIPLAIVFALIYFISPEWKITQPAGILVPEPPVLTPPSFRTSFQFNGYNVSALADYELTARVLDKALYHWGREADIAPVDLLLGWKDLSNTAILKYFSFHLSGRWYSWRSSSLPIPEDEINSELDNNHLIPATSLIEHQLKGVHVGRVIHIKGFLVRVDGRDGYNWHSSLSIGSTGGPLSCKLIYVTNFEVIR